MINNLNTSPENSNIEEIITWYKQVIFDEKIWIEEEMRKIAEVTYSYSELEPKTKQKLKIKWKNININTTLFCSLWWLNLENFNLLWDDEKINAINTAKKIFENKIIDKKNVINETINKLKWIQTLTLSDQYIMELFTDSLKEIDYLFEYCLNWIPYELEKAWIENNLTKENKKIIDSNQKKIDEIVFWWEIKNNIEEVISCYEYMLWRYEENKNKLSTEERKKYNYYLNKVKLQLPKNYTLSKKEPLENYLNNYKNVNIQDSEYILWFNLFIEALEKLKHIVKKDENVKSISDWPFWVQFPTTEKFKQLTLKRFLILNTHEIETHNITDHNNQQIIWNIKWAWSTIKDEWLAILMEELLQYWEQLFKKHEETWKLIIDIKKLEIKSTFVYILMWELLDNKELLEYLTLNEKIEKDTIEVKSRFDRLKRSNDSLVQHKDTSYIRWLFMAASEINKYILSNWKEWISIEDLFLWKVWFSDIHKLKVIKEEKEKSWNKIDIISPIFSSDTIFFSTEKKLNGEKITNEEFLQYLQKKYPIFNFSKQKINSISYNTKRNIAGVINIAIRNISETQLKNIPWKNSQLNPILKIINDRHNKIIRHAHKKMSPWRKNAS